MKKYLFTLLILFTLTSVVVACRRNDNEEDALSNDGTSSETEETETPLTEETDIPPTEEADTPSAEGGFVVASGFSDISTLNPILSADSASTAVIQQLFLGLLNIDPETGETIGEIAESWDISEDGLIYTFNLRDDVNWTDGTPITANDVKFTYDAIQSELVSSPGKPNFQLVDTIEAVDDATLTVTFSEVDCTALNSFFAGVLPAASYSADFTDIMTNTLNLAPTVTSGPFMFDEYVADDHVTLIANPDYYLGKPNLEGWIYRIVGEQAAEVPALLTGEVDYVARLSAADAAVIEEAIADGKDLNIARFPDDGYTYIGFNLANPENPQMGFDDLNENGEYDEGEPPLEQDPHPIFSDPAVRLAVAQSLDYTNIIKEVVFGEGIQATTNVLPAIKWAYNADLAPHQFDLEQAAQTLEDGGWLLNPDDNIRYKDGQRLEFSLMTNAGNTVRENIVLITQDTLGQLGFAVEADIIEFGAVVEKLLGQSFDAVVIGWTGRGTDPDDTTFFSYENDLPGAGFNFVSYYNEEVEEKQKTARSLPGCSTEERGELYYETQDLIKQDVPYAFLLVPNSITVWQSGLDNMIPQPWSVIHNIQDWSLTP